MGHWCFYLNTFSGNKKGQMSHRHITQLKNLDMGKFKRIRKKIINVRTEINKMENKNKRECT